MIRWIIFATCFHIMEYYTPMKGNELMIQSTTWMNIEGLIMGKK